MRLFSLFAVLPFVLGLVASPLRATGDSLLPEFGELAGRYYSGNGMGFNLSITLVAEGRFEYLWRGCAGVLEEATGGARLEQGVIKLTPARSAVTQRQPRSSAEYYPVRWGERLYLIEPKMVPVFCSAVNAGREPRDGAHGHFYLRTDDWKKPVTGRPEVPEAWAKYFLDTPVSGQVTKLLRQGEAWANIGTQNGILEGMELMVKSGLPFDTIRVRIEAAEKERCRIKCVYASDRLKAGLVISSRDPNE